MKARGATSTVAPVEEALCALRLEQVVQGVVEGPEVGVDLGHEITGEEPEPLTGLDGRSGEDDPVDLMGLERLDGKRNGQVGLAGAGRADAEGHDVRGDGVGVLLLSCRLRSDRPAP